MARSPCRPEGGGACRSEGGAASNRWTTAATARGGALVSFDSAIAASGLASSLAEGEGTAAVAVVAVVAIVATGVDNGAASTVGLGFGGSFADRGGSFDESGGPFADRGGPFADRGGSGRALQGRLPHSRVPREETHSSSMRRTRGGIPPSRAIASLLSSSEANLTLHARHLTQ